MILHEAELSAEKDVVQSIEPLDPARRRLLAGLLAAYGASLLPWALAQPALDANEPAFLAVSAILTGRLSLDVAQASRVYAALVADDPGFPASIRALLALITERSVELPKLQSVLDTERSPLAALPRRILSAWFLGIVGEGERARCIAFETALNAVIVEDVLKPPTYCYGVYGSWAKKPN